MDDTNITLTQNTAQCLRDVHQFGGYHVHNVCSGSTSWVPWGFWDWFALTFGVAFLAAMAVLVVAVVRS